MSPTFIELDASCTSIDATTLFASTDKLSALNGSIPVGESEHDITANSATTRAVLLVNMRFMMFPMNRATGFSWVVSAPTARSDAYNAPNAERCVTTGNAVGTARIYIRQAKHSYRHYG